MTISQFQSDVFSKRGVVQGVKFTSISLVLGLFNPIVIALRNLENFEKIVVGHFPSDSFSENRGFREVELAAFYQFYSEKGSRNFNQIRFL